MPLAPFAIVALPTVAWIAVWCWMRPQSLSFFWFVAGTSFGILLGGPVWLAESFVEKFATSTDRFARDFNQQVIGAACCEEVVKFVGVALLVFLVTRQHVPSLRCVVCVSMSVGIGFMTLENFVAVYAADSRLSVAFDRQFSIFAGHASFQVIMGWFIHRWCVTRWSGWAIASLLVPIFLHGWGDFSEALFQDEPNPNSVEDTVLFGAWIASLLSTAALAICVLFQANTNQGRKSSN